MSNEFVNEVIFRRLLHIIPDSIGAGEVANALQDEVMEDIVETADSENWHSGDVDIALARVLKKRLLNDQNNLRRWQRRKVNKNEMEVLIAYDYEDGSKQVIATMKDSDLTGEKTDAMQDFLTEHYDAWLDGCGDEERSEYLEEIKEAASLLATGISADCCGDNLYWETVTHI